jgi:hypothetical protein
MIKKLLPLITFSLMAGVSHADEYLTADQIKALITNKTFDVHNVVKDKHLNVYDDKNGNHYVYIPWKDKTKTREWWIEDNKHCTSHPKRGNSCKLLKDMGDGNYKGITNGEHTHTLSNFRDGNQLN